MKHQPEQMEQACTWEKLSLGEFGLQLNLLMELIPQSPPQEPILEELVDEEADELPGLEPIPEDEVQNAVVLTLEPHAMWMGDERFTPMIWTRMCNPLSPEQLSTIHWMEMEHVYACPRIG